MPEASPPAEGGAAVQVTKKGGYVAFESADGEFVYYAKGLFDTSLWRRPVGGGEETEVLPSLNQGTWIDRGDLGSIVKFYVNQNLQKIFTKWPSSEKSIHYRLTST